MVPLMHVLMSSRTRTDYTSVLKYIKEKVLGNRYVVFIKIHL